MARQPLREQRERETVVSSRPPMRVVKRDGTTGQVVEDYLGIPGQPIRHAEHAVQPEASGDYLDIPAFLRRQAD